MRNMSEIEDFAGHHFAGYDNHKGSIQKKKFDIF